MNLLNFSDCINFGLLLINLCKELPYIGNQEIGLLQSREVSAQVFRPKRVTPHRH